MGVKIDSNGDTLLIVVDHVVLPLFSVALSMSL